MSSTQGHTWRTQKKILQNDHTNHWRQTKPKVISETKKKKKKKKFDCGNYKQKTNADVTFKYFYYKVWQLNSTVHVNGWKALIRVKVVTAKLTFQAVSG
jgi:hypothetical protein